MQRPWKPERLFDAWPLPKAGTGWVPFPRKDGICEENGSRATAIDAFEVLARRDQRSLGLRCPCPASRCEADVREGLHQSLPQERLAGNSGLRSRSHGRRQAGGARVSCLAGSLLQPVDESIWRPRAWPYPGGARGKVLTSDRFRRVLQYEGRPSRSGVDHFQRRYRAHETANRVGRIGEMHPRP